MNDSKWKLLERIKLIGEIITIFIALGSFLFGIIQIIIQGLRANIPLWIFIIGLISCFTIGIIIGGKRNSKKKSKPIIRSYFDAQWEINVETRYVNGPLCPTCKVQMILELGHNPQQNRIVYIYYCKNPYCENRNTKLSKLPIGNPGNDEAYKRVLELFDAEERK